MRENEPPATSVGSNIKSAEELVENVVINQKTKRIRIKGRRKAFRPTVFR